MQPNLFLEKISIQNVEICSIYLADLLPIIKQGVLLTPNVDHLVKLKNDKDFLNCYQNADWVICDSKIINLAAKFLGKSIKEVIPGSSFFPAFYTFHKDNREIKLFLLGAANGVAEKAMENINKKVGWEMVVGNYSPSYGFENNEKECDHIIEYIKNTGANILIVGLGAPKQEKWIMKYKYRLPNIRLFMALGATIDFEAGNIKRAPVLIQKMNLEWLYRLWKEPKRLWRRYLIEDIPFLFWVLTEKWKSIKANY